MHGEGSLDGSLKRSVSAPNIGSLTSLDKDKNGLGSYFLSNDYLLKDRLDTIIFDLEKRLRSDQSELIKKLKLDQVHFVKNRLGILQGTYDACSSQDLKSCYFRLSQACGALLKIESLSERKKNDLTQAQESFFYKFSVISNGALPGSELSYNEQLFSLLQKRLKGKTEAELIDYRKSLSKQLLWKLLPAMQHRRFDRVMFLLNAYYEFYLSSFMFEEKGIEDILSSFCLDLGASFNDMPVKVQRRFSKGDVNLCSFEIHLDSFNSAEPWLIHEAQRAQELSKKAGSLLNTLRTLFARLPLNKAAQSAVEKKYQKVPQCSSSEDFAKVYSKIPRRQKRIIWKLLESSSSEEREKMLAEFESFIGGVRVVPTKKRSRVRHIKSFVPLHPVRFCKNHFFPHKFRQKHSAETPSSQQQSTLVR